MFVTLLIEEAARVFEIKPEDLTGRRRKKMYTHPRFALFKALRARGHSFPRIGRWMDRHHTTVITGVEVADWLVAHDKDYAEKVKYLSEVQFKDLK
jgi:chromosomal replication initiation ATPase DnaA